MSHEILTTAQMGAADAYAVAAGTPSLTLMENAGRAVADEIAARFAPCRVAVLCGPGNNGGDGYVVARLLKGRGFDAWVVRDAVGRGDAGAMATRWDGKSLALSPQALDGAALVVDALFGAGLARPLEGAYAATVEAANTSDAPVVAIDVPSGLSGDSGLPLGEVVIRAALTVTFFRKKPGHLLLPGRILCGALVVAEIGIPAQAAPSGLHENTPALWRYPWPSLEGHKYARGHCIVVSGPAHATGAARLAARGALRIGAGLVSVASPPGAMAVNAAQLTAIMVKPADGAAGLAALLQDRRLNAVVMGPGLGVSGETREMVRVALAAGAPDARPALVLDADALTAFQDDPDALFARLHDRCVLTPHAGEFARLFPDLLEDTAGKVEATRAAAARSGAVVLLKGADTVIAAPPGGEGEGRAAINANAPAWLATAGAGDVLAGFIGGLLAQGMDPFAAACAGAWLHGAAAAAFGPGLIAEDLPETLPRVLADLAQ
ncbi:MAG: NAD(P)H-hydrate dehydratase [Alphaproteobacteria bacterium]|nr:NAD(P)H-hydrate dehydratase [Alphaproteobacteria bacterium]